MRDSKSDTLDKYLMYLKKYYVNDKRGFNQTMTINGLNTRGQFTRNEFGQIIKR